MHAISFHIFILQCLAQQHACVNQDTDADADSQPCYNCDCIHDSHCEYVIAARASHHITYTGIHVRNNNAGE